MKTLLSMFVACLLLIAIGVVYAEDNIAQTTTMVGSAENAPSADSVSLPPANLSSNEGPTSDSNKPREVVRPTGSNIVPINARLNKALEIKEKISGNNLTLYYKERIKQAMEDNNTNATIREVRREIDETIKNLVEEKKKINYNEISQIAQDIKIRADRIDVGNSSTNATDAEIEVELNGKNMK